MLIAFFKYNFNKALTAAGQGVCIRVAFYAREEIVANTSANNVLIELNTQVLVRGGHLVKFFCPPTHYEAHYYDCL